MALLVALLVAGPSGARVTHLAISWDAGFRGTARSLVEAVGASNVVGKWHFQISKRPRAGGLADGTPWPFCFQVDTRVQGF
jgi:hypothetical protein